MGLRSIAKDEFDNLCVRATQKPPAGMTEAGWYASEDNAFLAVLLHNHKRDTWEYLIYSRVDLMNCQPAAKGKLFETLDQVESAITASMKKLAARQR